MLIKYSQWAVSLGFLVCLIAYIYLMTTRSRKGNSVDLKIWIVLLIGMLLGIAGQYLGTLQGVITWDRAKMNILGLAAFSLFSAWMIYRKLTRKAPEPQTKQKNPKQANLKKTKGEVTIQKKSNKSKKK